MAHRLLVNPGTPQAWEIQLRPGINRLGRGEQNDFMVSDGSVSTAHCEIFVNDAGVILKDLGSTNGTFVNRAPVREVALESGQHVQLGSVDMMFEAVGAPAPVSAAPLVARLVPPVPPPGGGLRISKAQAEPAVATAEETEVAAPPVVPRQVAPRDVGRVFCKSHKKIPAHFQCPRCNKYFCDLCVTTRAGNHYCRACGVELTPLLVHFAGPTQAKGFFARLPMAVVYPFRGAGILILLFATALFAALGFISGGIFGFFTKMMALGYLFLFMQNIIHSTAAEDEDLPSLPGMDGLFGAFFQLAGTVMICFGVPIVLLAINFFGDSEIPMAAIIATGVLGSLYFPMAFLAVAMQDSVAAANPLVVIPAILKVPLEYFVTAILVTGVFALRFAGDAATAAMSSVSMTTRSMSTLFIAFGVRALWAFASIYLLVVCMRILGLLYVTKKDKIGWF